MARQIGHFSFDRPLPHIHCFPHAADLFLVDSRRAIAANEPEHVIANIEACLGLARQITDYKFLVVSLNSFSVFEKSCQQTKELLASRLNLEDAQLLALQNLFSDFALEDQISVAGERAVFQDILQQLFTDDGNGDGKLTWRAMTMMAGMEGAPTSDSVERYSWNNIKQMGNYFTYSRKEIHDLHAARLKCFESQLHKRPFESPFDDENPDTGNTLIDMLYFDPQPIRMAFQKQIAQRDGIELALAITRFQLSNGKLPDSLDELIPNFIGQIPVDPMTGKDMLFRADDSNFRIYSVGLDMDDDGGEPVVLPQGTGTGRFTTDFYFGYDGEEHSGDWLLWSSEPVANAVN